MADFTVNPWEVKGNVDYDRLMKEFGTQKITPELLKRLEKAAGGELHHFLRRKLFFSHRDLDWLLGFIEKKQEFFLYTGRGPTGPMHIGHLIPFIITKWFQDKFGAELLVQFTDDEKFLFRDDLTLKDTNTIARENAMDVIAMGFNPKKTKFLIDSECAGILYPQAIQIAKKITFSTTKAVFGFENDRNIGEIFFTSMQAVPAILPSVLAGKNIPCLIPHGIDQDPHFRIARDVMPKLGFYKPASIHNGFIPSLRGAQSNGKMSASDPNSAVWLMDDKKTVENKIKKYAFTGGQPTIEEQRKKGANLAVDVPYQWLTYFEENDAKLKKIHDDYSSGKMLSSEIKQILSDKLNAFLEKHQAAREKAKDQLQDFMYKK